MELEVSAMTETDYDDTYALWRITEGIGLSDADSREAIAAYLQRNPGLSRVARRGGRLVGAVLCGHDGRRGYLHHLAVEKSERGRGLGRRLVTECLAGLAGAGIRRCHLFVYDGNHEGQGFWRRIGWRERTDLKLMSADTVTST